MHDQNRSAAPRVMLALSAGHDAPEEDQRSLTRRAIAVLAATLLLLAAPLAWAGTAFGSDLGAPVATKAGSTAVNGDDDDDDDSAGTTGSGDSGTNKTTKKRDNDSTNTTTSEDQGTTDSKTTTGKKKQKKQENGGDSASGDETESQSESESR